MFSGHVWIPPIPRATFRATSSSTSETRCKLPAYKAWKILRQSTKCVGRPKISKDHVFGYMAKNHENTTEHRWNTHSNTNIWNNQSWRHIIHKSRVCVDTTVIIPQNIVGLHKKTWNLSSMIWLDSFKFHLFGALLQPLYLLVLQMSIILAGVAALEIKPGTHSQYDAPRAVVPQSHGKPLTASTSSQPPHTCKYLAWPAECLLAMIDKYSSY